MTTRGETLGELIRRRKKELDLSFRQMGQRAVDAGLAIAQPNWDHLTKPIEEFPKMRTIHALAVALEVAPEDIGAAAANSLGLKLTKISLVDRPGEEWTVVSAENLDDEGEQIVGENISKAARETPRC
jgi:hypothetical protein